MSTKVDVYWFRLKQHTNFGDELGPAILSRLGYQPRWVEAHNAELVTIGSILEYVGEVGRDGTTIWGAGLISQQGSCTRDLGYRAVRGTLTRKRLNGKADGAALGDPGLLVSRLWNRPPVRAGIGVVPHYVDRRTFPWADRVVDVRRPVDEVIEAIASCDRVLSSSLHGLIVAAAFGIPAMRLHHPEVVGGDWKWMDYLTGLDEDLEKVQDRLIGALP